MKKMSIAALKTSAKIISALLLQIALISACDTSSEYRQSDLKPQNFSEQALSLENESVIDTLTAAQKVYRFRRYEAFLNATDPLERFESVIGTPKLQSLADQGNFEEIFRLGDEAFEAERDREIGFGQGLLPANENLPLAVMRIHNGEIGGYDSASCRSCHFGGGPDGSGTMTQVALLRGDAQHLSSATVRIAPHVQGLGYIELFTKYLTNELQSSANFWSELARAQNQAEEVELMAAGMSFGVVTFDENGVMDPTGLAGISPDLIVRPFGFKGRHALLLDVADEALHIHHGQQTSSYIFQHAHEKVEFLGIGPERDPDADGVEDELSDGQPLLLATYMSLLATPIQIRPESPDLVWKWHKGHQIFNQVGCNNCHIEKQLIQNTTSYMAGKGEQNLFFSFSPLQNGQDPKPQKTEFSSTGEGLPFFPFSDFRRHQMGAALADAHGEILPDSKFEVAADSWLTRPLWGLATSSPYLHDGRALTIKDAIIWHGGEAEDSSVAFQNLSADEQGQLLLFLSTLTREAVLLVE